MSDRHIDVAAIEAIITDHERAFNTKDADLLAAHFRERSWAVGVNGVEVEGRTALVEVAKRAFAGPLAEGRARIGRARWSSLATTWRSATCT